MDPSSTCSWLFHCRGGLLLFPFFLGVGGLDGALLLLLSDVGGLLGCGPHLSCFQLGSLLLVDGVWNRGASRWVERLTLRPLTKAQHDFNCLDHSPRRLCSSLDIPETWPFGPGKYSNILENPASCLVCESSWWLIWIVKKDYIWEVQLDKQLSPLFAVTRVVSRKPKRVDERSRLLTVPDHRKGQLLMQHVNESFIAMFFLFLPIILCITRTTPAYKPCLNSVDSLEGGCLQLLVCSPCPQPGVDNLWHMGLDVRVVLLGREMDPLRLPQLVPGWWVNKYEQNLSTFQRDMCMIYWNTWSGSWRVNCSDGRACCFPQHHQLIKYMKWVLFCSQRLLCCVLPSSALSKKLAHREAVEGWWGLWRGKWGAKLSSFQLNVPTFMLSQPEQNRLSTSPWSTSPSQSCPNSKNATAVVDSVSIPLLINFFVVGSLCLHTLHTHKHTSHNQNKIMKCIGSSPPTTTPSSAAQ